MSDTLLKQGEFNALTREAVDGKTVAVAFGPGWVALTDTPGNEWALNRLNEMRDNNGGANEREKIQNPMEA